MERRQHPRYPASLDVRLTDLGDQLGPTAGRMVDISKSGVSVLLYGPVPVHSVVRLDVGESVLYGHAVYCSPEGPQYRVGIAVEQVLLGGADLGGVLQQVLLEQMPATPGVLSADAYLG